MKTERKVVTWTCDACKKECDGRDSLTYDKELPNGVTPVLERTVTFGVWPKQENYCLCKDCMREALKKALERLDDELSASRPAGQRGAVETLQGRLKEVGYEV